MLIHIAIFKWKPEANSKVIDETLATIRSLQNEILGIESIYCGQNFSKWSEGYTHAVVVIGHDQSALDAYRNHPIHELAAKSIEAMEEKGIGVDFFDPVPLK